MLLSIAAIIANYATPLSVWSISIVLIVIGIGFQIVGHQLFERRQPALMDNPRHLLLGPMFVMAKLFIALGFRSDLAAIIERAPQPGTSRLFLRRGTSGRAPTAFMTRVLVTGGSGFIGQHLVSALVARNQQVRVLDLLPPTHLLPDVQYIEGSVLDPDLVDDALNDVGEVYHLAGSARHVAAAKKMISTPSIAAAPRSSSRPRASAASHGSCTARPNRFFSGSSPSRGYRCEQVPAVDPTTCRARIRARNCSRSSLPAQAAASGFPVVIGCTDDADRTA